MQPLNKRQNRIRQATVPNAASRKAARDKKKRLKKRNTIIAAVVAAVVLILIVYQVGFGKNAYDVTVAGNSVCIIDKSKITSEDISNNVVASLEEELGTSVKLKDEIALVPVHASSSKVVTTEYAITQVRNAVGYEVEAGVIIVDGTKAAVVSSKDEADNLLESILGKYAPENADVTKCEFEQTVITQNQFVDSSEILSFEEAYKKLTYTTPVEQEYTVVSGDTLWLVANKMGMTIEEIKTLNSLDSENLKIGQTLKVTRQMPFLTVVYNGAAS